MKWWMMNDEWWNDEWWNDPFNLGSEEKKVDFKIMRRVASCTLCYFTPSPALNALCYVVEDRILHITYYILHTAIFQFSFSVR